MKQEQVIELAKKAGFFFHDAGHGPDVLHTLPREYSQKCFERLIAEVEQATLERAALVCDGMQDHDELKKVRKRVYDAQRAGDEAEELMALKHESTVSVFNAGLRNAAKEIRSLAKD